MNIIEAIHNNELFRPCFKTLDSWAAWLVLLSALFGLEMEKEGFSPIPRLYRPTEGTWERVSRTLDYLR